MDKRIPPLEEIFTRLLDTEETIASADLKRLSTLDSTSLVQFKKHWKNSIPQRRKLVLDNLVDASENDATLDFTAVFSFCIEDSESDIRISAIEGLELEDRYTYFMPLLKLMKFDESAEVRARSALALGKLSMQAILDELPEEISREVFSALLEKLEDHREPVMVRRRALEAIAPFHQEPVGSYIEDFYFSEDELLKASSLFAMGKNCDLRWLKYLLDEAQSDNAMFRYESAKALGGLGDEDGVATLIDLLEDNNTQVQEAAILALGQTGGKEARRALDELSKSDDPRIKEAAQAALDELLSCEDPLSMNF